MEKGFINKERGNWGIERGIELKLEITIMIYVFNIYEQIDNIVCVHIHVFPSFPTTA